MRAEEITGLINKHISFDESTLRHLSDVIEEYPYFQTARLLYVLNLQARKDTRVLPEIRKTACYVGDRKKFFYLIEKDFAAFLFAEAEKAREANSNTPFDLIDLFLKQKEEKMKKDMLPPDLSDSRQLALTDYMTYSLSDANRNPKAEEAPKLRNQEKIDDFISKDEKSEIKIVLNGKSSKDEILPPEPDKSEGSGFFSETLVKIYLKQKKYEKALDIIIKLNLVYPEKSIYFADQIRFLEKLVIHKKK